MVRTVNPKARATPAKPMPRLGNAAASTALPQPPNTSQNVPKNSAVARRPSVIVFLLNATVVIFCPCLLAVCLCVIRETLFQVGLRPDDQSKPDVAGRGVHRLCHAGRGAITAAVIRSTQE